MSNFIQDKERMDMGASVAGYQKQLKDIATQAVAISIQISDAKAVVQQGPHFLQEDKALMNSLEKVVVDPKFTAFISLIQTGVA